MIGYKFIETDFQILFMQHAVKKSILPNIESGIITLQSLYNI